MLTIVVVCVCVSVCLRVSRVFFLMTSHLSHPLAPLHPSPRPLIGKPVVLKNNHYFGHFSCFLIATCIVSYLNYHMYVSLPHPAHNTVVIVEAFVFHCKNRYSYYVRTNCYRFISPFWTDNQLHCVLYVLLLCCTLLLFSLDVSLLRFSVQLTKPTPFIGVKQVLSCLSIHPPTCSNCYGHYSCVSCACMYVCMYVCVHLCVRLSVLVSSTLCYA